MSNETPTRERDEDRDDEHVELRAEEVDADETGDETGASSQDEADGDEVDGDEVDGDEVDGPDLERRFLCSDGACIGLIGASGRCKVCGEPIAADERAAFERAFAGVTVPDDEDAAEVEDAAESSDDGEERVAGGESGEDEAGTDGDGPDEDALPIGFDPTQRQLCSDGACIGVIGAEGKCGVCGKKYEGEPE